MRYYSRTDLNPIHKLSNLLGQHVYFNRMDFLIIRPKCQFIIIIYIGIGLLVSDVPRYAHVYILVPNIYSTNMFINITITITNYLFRQNRTRNITKVILITHIKIPTLQHYNVCAKEITLKTSWPLAYNHV